MQCQAAEVGKCQGLVPLVPVLSGNHQGRVEVTACLWNASLPPQAQRQQVVDHSPLRRAVGALGGDVHE